jgi:4,5-DOPA dioxygenase extradiol
MKAPVLFIGHGSPTNAIEDNEYTRAWRQLGADIKADPRYEPLRAIVIISAHWGEAASVVSLSPAPETIYDFYGFPEELYRIKYAPPGDPQLARAVAERIAAAGFRAGLSPVMGLDHGAWSALVHLFPDAQLPCFQLSYDESLAPQKLLEIGAALAPLRREGIVLLGSGNIVHNLRQINFNAAAAPNDWAVAFDALVRDRILARDFSSLAAYSDLGESALRAIPTSEHWLPLLYILGAIDADDEITFPVEGVQNGSISMRAVRAG